jgi:hypothetical protein
MRYFRIQEHVDFLHDAEDIAGSGIRAVKIASSVLLTDEYFDCLLFYLIG